MVTTLANAVSELNAAVEDFTVSYDQLEDRVTDVEFVVSAPHRIVFVTSVIYDPGTLQGVEGGDSACQTLADAAGLEGRFLAWLSDATQSPSTRFVRSETDPYVLVDGTQIASNWSTLIDGDLDAPIGLYQTGEPHVGSSLTWTRTLTSGEVADDTCNSWTTSSANVYGKPGSNSQAGSEWTEVRSSTCDNPGHLYCFQQEPVPVRQHHTFY